MKTDAERLDWLEKQFGLHKEVEITYVVDGYEIEFMYDCNPTNGKKYHGATLRDAIDAASAPVGKPTMTVYVNGKPEQRTYTIQDLGFYQRMIPDMKHGEEMLELVGGEVRIFRRA